jgi:hypothetical protein
VVIGLAALVEQVRSACLAKVAWGIGRGPHIWEIRGQNQCYLAISEDSHPHPEQAHQALPEAIIRRR